MYSQHSCSSVICSADILLQITFKLFFNSSTKWSLWHKELPYFSKTLPLDISIFLENEKNMGE